MEQQEEQKQITIIKRVLFMEDDEACQRFMTCYLQELDYEVDLIDDGIKAIQRIHSKAYDLILADIRLNGTSGEKVIQYVRNSELNAGTPIIVWSAFVNNSNDEEKYLAWGADGALIKWCTYPVLKNKIQQCLLTPRYERKFHFQLKGIIEKWGNFLNEARGVKGQFTRKLEFILYEVTTILKEHRQWLDFQQNEE